MAAVLEQRHDILEAIYRRRAVRAYTAQTPSEALVRSLLDAAVHAPTAMHTDGDGRITVEGWRGDYTATAAGTTAGTSTSFSVA